MGHELRNVSLIPIDYDFYEKQVAKFDYELFHAAYTEFTFNQYFAFSKVVILDGKVVAFYLCRNYYKTVLSIHTLAVKTAYQGRGIGSRLIEDVIAEARPRSIARISLCTQTDNIIAQDLYKSFGFKKVARDRELDVYYMSKRIHRRMNV